MTDRRAYGTVATREEAVAELRRSAGTQFDAAIVEVACGLDLSSAAAERRPRQLATEAMVVEAPKKNGAPAMPGGGGIGRWTSERNDDGRSAWRSRR